MGNDTMANLAKHAAKEIPRELLPQLGDTSEAPDTDPAPRTIRSTLTSESAIGPGTATADEQSCSSTGERSPATPSSRAETDSEATGEIDYYAESEPPRRLRRTR